MNHNGTRAPLIIPIFISHEGCPHRCLFCNQSPITGVKELAPAVQASDVKLEIDKWLTRSPRRGRQIQVAFYGGSFTAISLERQQELLGAVQPFLRDGRIDFIRLSTRPDYIDAATADFLWGYGVRVVELGIQSMNDETLTASRRGHTLAQSIQALEILTASKIKTGAQLMIGLPAETTAGALRGAKHLTRLKPDFARIYPALVIKGSGLAALYEQKKYRPLTLNRTIVLAAKIKNVLAANGIPVIRIGLPPSTELAESLIAGPYHPALGELVAARIFFKRVRKILRQRPATNHKLIIAARDRSIFYGQKKCSLYRLKNLGLLDKVTVIFANTIRGQIELRENVESVI
ncbi:MAG: radical SAM protein [Deltaproteobacteria bacterium]|nr:radical SAM protein [Deltaproteobacteria bacterium]